MKLKKRFPYIIYNLAMTEYNSQARRSWIASFRKSGNISQVCKEFGISRPTFYKWLNRSDPNNASKPLLSRSRRPRSRPARIWGKRELIILADIDHATHGRLSAVKLSERLLEREVRLSRSTVWCMVTKIDRKCPICRQADRVHDELSHRWSRRLISLTRSHSLLQHATKLAAGDATDFKQDDHPIQCQAEIKNGYRQCKNLTSKGRPFCQYHSRKNAAVEGLWRN